MPGGMAATERTMTATISAIDKSASSITFVGPNDWKYSRRVVDPKVFDQVKVGDQVDITWITDLTVVVRSAAAPSAGQPARTASAVDPNLVGIWESRDNPCSPCTLTINADATTSFTLAGSDSANRVFTGHPRTWHRPHLSLRGQGRAVRSRRAMCLWASTPTLGNLRISVSLCFIASDPPTPAALR